MTVMVMVNDGEVNGDEGMMVNGGDDGEVNGGDVSGGDGE